MVAGNGKYAQARIQYGALPYREFAAGLEILLVTSRQSRHWIIPKGWPIRGLEPYRSAAREAYEEAGVLNAQTDVWRGSLKRQRRESAKSGRPSPKVRV